MNPTRHRVLTKGQWYDSTMVNGKETLTPVPIEVLTTEREAHLRAEKERIASKGHDCHEFTCHGMYERENGSLNDYYYCGKCDETLQVG